MGPDSYYDTLGVSRDADDKEIRKAYRDLARKYHPDVCKEPGAEERFKGINEAYSVLSDAQKRAQYDQLGHDAYSNASRGSYSGAGGPTGGFNADFSGFGEKHPQSTPKGVSAIGLQGDINCVISSAITRLVDAI